MLLVRCWYCVVMVLVWLRYGFGLLLFRLYCFGMVLLCHWYGFGMVLVLISTSHHLANAILDPRVFTNELGRPKADRATQTYSRACNSEPEGFH